jgi:putative FmdB family regulatory protein
MPIYEYQCQSCGHQYEALQKISEAPLTECPACKKPELIKKISATGFRLKGVGWYETDFKSGSKKNVASEAASSNASSTSAASPTSSTSSSD